MDLRKVKKLIELVEASGIAELEIVEGEESVRISRQKSTGMVSQDVSSGAQLVNVAPPVVAANATTNTLPASGAVSKSEFKEEDCFRSPMVGVFYRSPSPNAHPFVKEGQKVKAGDTLCIIEAMKLMNEIEAEKPGVIVKVLVEDGAPVEYGEPLFILA
ncbi:MAG: acetyl-CoA carboxylase biotin carboxyl carrier protein [Neisseriaceae bacterium]